MRQLTIIQQTKNTQFINQSTSMQTLSYKKLTQYQTPHTQSKLTNEQRFWKKYQNSIFYQSQKNSVNCIASNNNAKNVILIGQGRNLKIVDGIKKQTLRQINTFYENVSALCVRPDGNVFAAADESGRIEVMDVKEKFHLRKFHNHKKKINALQYLDNDLYSAGDDFVIRHYDVAAGQVVHSYDKAHTDYIKAIKALQNNHILSGAYDGIVKLFDFRVHEKAQLQFKHEQQIQTMDLYPSKLNFIVGGGTKVSIWDIRTGKSLFEGRNNKKVVTNIKLISQGSRYITTSLDNYLKVFKSDTYELTHQQKLEAGILTFDTTSNSQCLALGLQGGKVVFKSRKPKTQDQASDQQLEVEDQIALWLKKNEQKKFAYNDTYFYRGIYQTPTTFDIKFERFQSKKLGILDNYLKKFQYKKALNECIKKKNMTIFLSLIDELIQRGILTKTISTLSADQVTNLVDFLRPLIRNEKYSKISNFVLLKVLEIHETTVNLTESVFSLTKQVDRQLETIDNLTKLDGMLEMAEGLFADGEVMNLS